MISKMLLEQIPDVIPLTSSEKTRFAELEGTVETHLESFLAAGRALSEIRSRRLYRENFVTFDRYVQDRWGLHRSRADDLIRSFGCAELLLSTTGAPNGDTPLPPNCPESVLRPVSTLPTDELRSVTWEVIARSAPPDKPSRAVARQICKMVREAVGPPPQPTGGQPSQPSQDGVVFLRPIQRLARLDFNPEVACLHVDDQEHATRIISACDTVIDRCRQIQTQLLSMTFP